MSSVTSNNHFHVDSDFCFPAGVKSHVLSHVEKIAALKYCTGEILALCLLVLGAFLIFE